MNRPNPRVALANIVAALDAGDNREAIRRMTRHLSRSWIHGNQAGFTEGFVEGVRDATDEPTGRRTRRTHNPYGDPR